MELTVELEATYMDRCPELESSDDHDEGGEAIHEGH